jgi:hypothetical protein
VRLLLRPSKQLRFAILTAAVFVAACASPAHPRRIGLFTSLPIVWRETGNLGDLLKSDAPPHWALALLREQGVVEPIDSFLSGPNAPPLMELDRLVMAQPRALAPGENVALDYWVRGGGRLLLFADPMLTADSAFALGDRRRPEAIVMLSPILARWGLRLEFDEEQPAGEQQAELLGTALPVNLPGRLVATGTGGHCRLLSGGLVAQCWIGKGKALILADAALLEDVGPDERPLRRQALDVLLGALGED